MYNDSIATQSYNLHCSYITVFIIFIHVVQLLRKFSEEYVTRVIRILHHCCNTVTYTSRKLLLTFIQHGTIVSYRVLHFVSLWQYNHYIPVCVCWVQCYDNNLNWSRNSISAKLKLYNKVNIRSHVR